MFGGGTKPEQDIDDILHKVALGNASDSVLQHLNDYINTSVDRFISQWVNYDITQIKSDAGIINFHESYRQAIRTHLLLKTRMTQSKFEGREAEKSLK